MPLVCLFVCVVVVVWDYFCSLYDELLQLVERFRREQHVDPLKIQRSLLVLVEH